MLTKDPHGKISEIIDSLKMGLIMAINLSVNTQTAATLQLKENTREAAAAEEGLLMYPRA